MASDLTIEGREPAGDSRGVIASFEKPRSLLSIYFNWLPVTRVAIINTMEMVN